MTTILVTGSAGFIGKHLVEALGRRQNVRVIGYDIGNTQKELHQGLGEADFIFHLAGVNRPQRLDEFKTGNADLSASICESLSALWRNATIVLSSSIQAEVDNPYGRSKLQAEESLKRWAEAGGQKTEDRGQKSEDRSQESEVGGQRTEDRGQRSEDVGGGRRAVIFRLKNVFGKWCRPNYNSVTATFCHNIAHDLPITITDPGKELELVYIDDVIAAFLEVLDSPEVGGQRSEVSNTEYRDVPRSFRVTLGELAAKIRSFRDSRTSLVVPSFADAFTRFLYATYLSYLDGADLGYNLGINTDNRGCLAEFMKSAHFGQIFVSRTKPGITRGDHYHHTKTEKFFVVEGEAVIRLRHVQSTQVFEHRISGRDFRVVDIPPGYTHSIENVGSIEMVVLFWASEIFDPQRPDTYPAPVVEGRAESAERRA